MSRYEYTSFFVFSCMVFIIGYTLGVKTTWDIQDKLCSNRMGSYYDDH